MPELVATNLILIVLAVVGWAGFFTLAYALQTGHPAVFPDADYRDTEDEWSEDDELLDWIDGRCTL